MVKPGETYSMTYIQSVKGRYEAELLQKANVVGVGVGLRMRQGQPVGPPAIIVNVTHKVPLDELHPNDRIPRTLDGIRVWVEVIGEVRAQQARAEEAK